MVKKEIAENIIETWKKTGKINIVKSSGRCMLPLFDDGTPLVIKYIQPEDIRIGDIALFRSGERTVVHRVVKRFFEKGKIYFWEKRDSTFELGVITGEAIIGKVIGIQSGKRYINLEKGVWRLTNSLLGYYWLFIYSFYNLLRGTKLKYFPDKSFKLTKRIYSLSSSLLIYIAHNFVSLLHKILIPRDR